MVERIRRIWAFVRKDLLESVKNRSIFIAVILPVLASLLFGVLDQVQAPKQFTLGIVQGAESDFAQFVEEMALNIKVEDISQVEEGQRLVQRGDLDGLVVVRDQDWFQVFLDSSRPVQFFALRENLTDLLNIYLQVPVPYDLEVIPVGTDRVSRSVLPVWLTITLSMIGIMVVSGMFAEEKDGRTLDAIGVSPVGYHELLVGKGLFGVLLSLGTALIMLILNGAVQLGAPSLLALGSLLLGGSLCFTGLGLLIGVLAPGQSTARSAATMLYFPLLFPTLISDLSDFTRILASFFPTFYLFSGLEALLLQGRTLAGIGPQLGVLYLFAALILGATAYAFRRMVNTVE